MPTGRSNNIFRCQNNHLKYVDAEFSVPKIDNKKLNPMAANEIPTGITSVLRETRVFKPASEFSKRSQIKSLGQYRKLYQESIRSPEKFWGKAAKNELAWFKPWTKVLQWERAVREMVRRRQN